MALITIVGPTACGKTARAVALAKSLNGEILSGDSRQVYRSMDLGTGKDIEEYRDIPYHLIDIAEAGDKYNLHLFIKDFRSALKQVEQAGKQPIFCGGSGLYVESALSGIILPEVPSNPELRAYYANTSLVDLTEILNKKKKLHNQTDVDTVARAIRALEIADYYEKNPDKAILADRESAEPIESIIIGIDIPRDVRRERISHRLDERLKSGMIEEVENILNKGVSPDALIYYGLEYKFITLYVIGKMSYQEMYKGLETAIHQFAKRQMTWWRGMERRGFKINWLPYNISEEEFTTEVRKLLAYNF